MSLIAYTGAAIFDGAQLHVGKALLVDGRRVDAIADAGALPASASVQSLNGGTILPGFVDLQVNGGGGVMFNHETTAAGVARIAAAHASTGTAALLPTLITDTPERTRAAVDAVETAIASGVPGILGIHLEGPHLSVARKGAHDPALIRPMEDADEAFLIEAAGRLPNIMVTVAPESVTPDQITRLAQAGIIVSLGHSDCSHAEAMAAFAAGARCVTHLFNAMSQLGSREPGLLGAALGSPSIHAGLISDGIHVHTHSMKVALAASPNLFLVTDAMSTVGSDITEFHLNGRRVLRENGRLTLEDGTLAGADLEFSTALSVLIDDVKIDPARAFAMATSGPAEVLNSAQGFGRLTPGATGPVIHLDDRHRFTSHLTV